MVKRKYGAAPDAGVWLGVQPARKVGGKPTARVRVGVRWKYLGSFDTVVAAARGVDDVMFALRGERPNWKASGVHAELDPATPAPAQRSRSLARALRECAEVGEPRLVRDPLRTRVKPRRPYVGVKCAGLCSKAGDQPIWTACYSEAVFGRCGTAELAAA